jgi:hypothetical protein
MMGINLYKEFRSRTKDKYPSKELEEYLVDKIFPKNPEELALVLSNVTAGFYGFTLKHVGQQCGWDKVDSISKSVFMELGQLKTKEAQERGIEIPRDTRALAIVFISAIYTSSPEYNFEFLRYTPKETIMRIFGASRYSRIARKLDIDEYISWPVLIPFFEGIAQQVGIECKIEMKIEKLEKDGNCDCLTKFTLVPL